MDTNGNVGRINNLTFGDLSVRLSCWHSETGQTNRLESNLDGSAVNVRFQNPATPQPLRPLRFQKRTFTAPIITQFDTFNQT
jgi:hypothetical protein